MATLDTLADALRRAAEQSAEGMGTHRSGLTSAARLVREWTDTDAAALDEISALLDGRVWDVEDIERVAAIVRGTGRNVREPREAGTTR